MTIPATELTLKDGVRIIVPDSLNLITTYVLREQQDWFEDEIGFLRRLIQPGQKVIDIGANYGVYTLTLARLVGPGGHVWAFEPASATARLLGASIAANDFGNVTLEQCALSDRQGQARLSLHDNSELNMLVHDPESAGSTEPVALTTLDEGRKQHDWQDVDFVKLDAEGEEGNILRGGARFLATESPLVQYEVKAGTELHLELVQAFGELGYHSYRLVPGIDALVPFDSNEPADGYLLNLFACKPDRAAALAEAGFLVERAMVSRFRADHPGQTAGVPGATRACDRLAMLEKLPYGLACSDSWQASRAVRGTGEVEAALCCYLAARDASQSAAGRFSALEESYRRLKALCEAEPAHLRLSSLARVARDYGARSTAVQALGQLCNSIFNQQQADTGEPFLAPGERFDSIPPLNGMHNWIAAAAMEELERLAAYSSFYSGESALQRLEIIRRLGLGSDEMRRRLELVRMRTHGAGG